MARVKRAVHGKKHRRAILEQAQGHYGNRSRSFRSANESVMHAGNYAFRESLFGSLAKFGIMEVGFGRFARTGISVAGEKLPDDVGGGLLAAQLTQFGHSSTVDFGKRPYADGENGGISGIVEYATTRNESDARMAAAEDYEPGIPGVTVRVSSLGDDGEPNTPDDVLLNPGRHDHAEQAIFALADERIRQGFEHIKHPAERVLEKAEAVEHRDLVVTGVPTGFRGLDALTSGLQKQDLVVIAARPSMGKTSLALTLAQHAAI